MEKIQVKKKRKGVIEEFAPEKIHAAIRKSAYRVMVPLNDEDCEKVSNLVISKIDTQEITVKKLHNLVEICLDEAGFSRVAESYRQYRNYKDDSQKILEAVDRKTLELSYHADLSNANADSMLVSTKRSILFGEQQKEIYERLYLNPEELEAIKRGYLYCHDKKDRLSSFNCSLANLGRILKGGFVLSEINYTEPKSLAAAISVSADLISSIASQQYGGLSICQVDEIWAPYAQKSYEFYCKQFLDLIEDNRSSIEKGWRKIKKIFGVNVDEETFKKMDKYAEERVRREAEQQIQHIEHNLNSISSSRGDFSFVSFSFGHGTDRWAKLISNVILDVRRGGQGKEGAKVPVLFPKLIFLYDSELHGPGKELEDLFDNAIETSKLCMYPDFLSLDAGYVGEVYHKYGRILTCMGCRSFLSPIFKKSGWTEPLDETDEFVLYRFNGGVVSLNLPMIYSKSKRDGTEFFEELDCYLQIARGIHRKTRDFLSKLKASCNPLMFCEGGLDGGNLGPDDTIESVLKYSTFSFGYLALHELTKLHLGKSLKEDQSFALETMRHINEVVDQFKEEDKLLYSVYSAPAESLASIACEQYIKEFGKVRGITTDGFFTNSFHLHVSEDVTPIEKINIESQFFPLAKGGCICHVKTPSIGPEMNDGIKAIIRHAMSLGLYQSINHSAGYCYDCGSHFIAKDELEDYDEANRCPECGSIKTIGIRRIK